MGGCGTGTASLCPYHTLFGFKQTGGGGGCPSTSPPFAPSGEVERHRPRLPVELVYLQCGEEYARPIAGAA